MLFVIEGFAWLEFDDWTRSAGISLRIKVFLLFLVEVLSWVGGFVLEHLDECVESRGQEGA